MKQAKSGNTPWYFGPFVVFATNRNSAKQVYEEALKSRSAEKTGGAVVLPDGQEGYWELLWAGDAASQAQVRHSAR